MKNDDLYFKFASALATLMWHFMKTEIGRSENKKIVFVSRGFIFNHVRTMLNPKALIVDGSV